MAAAASGGPSNTTSKWGSQIDAMLAQGRRSSAASIIQRLRSGSLTGWTGGGPIFVNPFKSTTFAPTEGDEFGGQPSQFSRIPQRLRRMSIDPSIWKKHGNASLGSVLSALYAKLLVVMGMAFPMSEAISSYIPPAYYEGFYLYLYIVSILFMGWLFIHVIKQRAKKEITKGVNTIKSRLHHKSITDTDKSDDDEDDDDPDEEADIDEEAPKKSSCDSQPTEGENTNSEATAPLTSSIESSTLGSKEEENGNETNSEDSDDKLSPLITEDKAASPFLLRRPSPIPPTVSILESSNNLIHPISTPPIQSLHSSPLLQPIPTITIQPINNPHHNHHHHHNHHVTINSPPGHDGCPSSRFQHSHHHHHHHHRNPHNNQFTPNSATSLQTQQHKDSSGLARNSNGSSSSSSKGKLSRTQSMESSKYDGYHGQRTHFGSFYLRMGAVAFGIGSMIYSCLEFGQFLEQEPDTKCHSLVRSVTPIIRMIFTFMQMYFIFLNSSMSVSKVSWVKQFGLMHMIGTNLCVWLNVLVEETKHEILHFYDPENGTITVGHGLNYYGKPKALEQHAKVVTAASSTSIASALIADDYHHQYLGGMGHGSSSEEDDHQDNLFLSAVNSTLGGEHGAKVINRLRRGLKGPHSIYECARENIMGSLVNSASPFLFPCTIEYSLICAAICYVMWKSMAKRRVKQITLKKAASVLDSAANHQEVRNVHHYTVDCAGSNKGLFIGIFFLVFTIMSLILNFVLMKHHEHLEFAFWEVNLTEVTLYSVSTLAVLIGMCQMRQLKYESGKNLELDNILLIVAQSGSFMFNVFCIVGGHLTPLETESSIWILVTPLLCLIQLLLQTLFILDASKRVVSTPETARKKPGREIITFLLVTNLAMWLINALEKSRGDSHPHLLRFFGVWAWTIITDISMPLAIFYRFHSTVCLCEIWKKAYKVRNKFGHEPLLHV